MSNQKMKILVVEDNPGDTQLIEEALEQEGKFNLIHGFSLQTTPWHLPEDNIEAVLLNLSFPGSVGLEILGQIHKLDINLPIIALTPSFNESEYLKVLKLGARDYFPLNLFDGSALADALFYLRQCRGFGIVPQRSSYAAKLEHSLRVVRGADRRLARPAERRKEIL